ncbi:MAG: AraC family transcriptional regulator [Dongiaceae bacterium]
MAYQQHEPIAAFRSVIDAYWINRARVGDAAPFDRVLPDGCIDLIFRGGAAGGRLFAGALIERPMFVSGGETAWFVGVRFRPAMARALLDIDPVDCRDREIPAAAIAGSLAALEARLQDCASSHDALGILRRAVDERLAQGERRLAPQRVCEAIDRLARGAEIQRVARMLGMAERTLHRDLVCWSGLAPKSLARILRMQRCLAALRAGRAPLALVALRLGYADQAHMTRELKELTGFRPSEIAAASRRPVRNLQDAA